MTRAGISAAIALAAIVPAASAARALVATPGGSKVAVLVTTTTAGATTTTTTTVPRASATTTTVRRRGGAAPEPRTSVKTKHPERPKPAVRRAVTTTTSNFAKRAAARAHALAVCLERAAANNYLAVAANRTWYRRQLRGLAGRPKLAAARGPALQIEEEQAQAEMQAQYAIDQSNCYLKHG